jgi:hypothetical protein
LACLPAPDGTLPGSLTHREGSQFAEFAEAIAQRIDLMAASDRQQVGAVGAVGLVGAVDRGAPVGRAACIFRGKSATNSGMKSATDSDLMSAIPI